MCLAKISTTGGREKKKSVGVLSLACLSLALFFTIGAKGRSPAPPAIPESYKAEYNFEPALRFGSCKVTPALSEPTIGPTLVESQLWQWKEPVEVYHHAHLLAENPAYVHAMEMAGRGLPSPNATPEQACRWLSDDAGTAAFRAALSTGLKQSLTANGCSFLGHFATVEEMTYRRSRRWTCSWK